MAYKVSTELTMTTQKTCVLSALHIGSPTSCKLVGLSKNLSAVHLLGIPTPTLLKEISKQDD